MSSAAFISKAKSEDFDVCIIGGGITGAGILTPAVQRGWKAVLIDSQDFASGTSSRSSKMIHGGLRYLKMLQFGLVRKALLDLEHLLLTYPQLVKPLPFIMPSYHSSLDLALKAVVIRFYGKLAGKSTLKKSQKLAPDKVLRYLPGFKQEGLKGGVLYWDGWTNDALLTINALHEAVNKGAVVLNYCEAKKFNRSGEAVQSLACVDRTTGEELTINAKVFINASGVWTDDVLKLATGKTHKIMKPSKGVHVVVSNKKIVSDYVAIVPSGTSDKRLLYSFPWEHGLTVLGTTDTEYKGSTDKIEITEEEVHYILNAFNKSFPSANLTTRDIVSVYAGLRPMLEDKNDKGSYSRSREYRIWWSADNFLNIAGGKLTSFLSMGKRCIAVAEKKLAHRLHGNAAEAKNAGLSQNATIENMLKEDAALATHLVGGLEVRGAEVVYHTRYLYAQALADVLTRRTALTYAMKDFDESAVRNVAAIMARELNRSSDWIEVQVKEFYEHWKEYHPDFLNS